MEKENGIIVISYSYKPNSSKIKKSAKNSNYGFLLAVEIFCCVDFSSIPSVESFPRSVFCKSFLNQYYSTRSFYFIRNFASGVS